MTKTNYESLIAPSISYLENLGSIKGWGEGLCCKTHKCEDMLEYSEVG